MVEGRPSSRLVSLLAPLTPAAPRSLRLYRPTHLVSATPLQLSPTPAWFCSRPEQPLPAQPQPRHSTSTWLALPSLPLLLQALARLRDEEHQEESRTYSFRACNSLQILTCSPRSVPAPLLATAQPDDQRAFLVVQPVQPVQQPQRQAFKLYYSNWATPERLDAIPKSIGHPPPAQLVQLKQQLEQPPGRTTRLGLCLDGTAV